LNDLPGLIKPVRVDIHERDYWGVNEVS
jgi:hypothetical protein